MLSYFQKKKSQTPPSAWVLCPRTPFVVRVVHRFPRQVTEMSRLPNKKNGFGFKSLPPSLAKSWLRAWVAVTKRFEFDLQKTKISERFP